MIYCIELEMLRNHARFTHKGLGLSEMLKVIPSFYSSASRHVSLHVHQSLTDPLRHDFTYIVFCDDYNVENISGFFNSALII